MKEFFGKVRRVQQRYKRIRIIRFARVEILMVHWRRLEMEALSDVISWEEWVLGKIDPEVVAGDLVAVWAANGDDSVRASAVMRRRDHHSRTRPLPDEVVQLVLYKYVVRMQKEA